jgi:hypothetical protein
MMMMIFAGFENANPNDVINDVGFPLLLLV